MNVTVRKATRCPNPALPDFTISTWLRVSSRGFADDFPHSQPDPGSHPEACNLLITKLRRNFLKITPLESQALTLSGIGSQDTKSWPQEQAK